MFKYLNKQGVQSDKGFIVQSINRFIIEYRESSKVISISVERGLLPNGKAGVCIYPDAFFRWDDGTAIPAEKQQEIMKNFKEAIEFQGGEVEVLISSR